MVESFNSISCRSRPGRLSLRLKPQGIDVLIARIQARDMSKQLDIDVLVARNGPIQEVSQSSRWGQEFLKLAERVDSVYQKV